MPVLGIRVPVAVDTVFAWSAESRDHRNASRGPSVRSSDRPMAVSGAVCWGFRPGGSVRAAQKHRTCSADRRACGERVFFRSWHTITYCALMPLMATTPSPRSRTRPLTVSATALSPCLLLAVVRALEPEHPSYGTAVVVVVLAGFRAHAMPPAGGSWSSWRGWCGGREGAPGAEHWRSRSGRS